MLKDKLTSMIAKLQAIENNEEKNKMQRENSEDNKYADKVCFLFL